MCKVRFLVPTMVALSSLLGACSAISPTEPSEQRARETLVQFFDLLASGSHEAAAPLYGGTYDTLMDWNPTVDPANHSALWQNGCQINGLQCLSVRSAEFVERVDDGLLFAVEFSNPDGSLFVRGPCCGADETQMPSVSQFHFRVQQTSDGAFLVLDVPVYVP